MGEGCVSGVGGGEGGGVHNKHLYQVSQKMLVGFPSPSPNQI